MRRRRWEYVELLLFRIHIWLVFHISFSCWHISNSLTHRLTVFSLNFSFEKRKRKFLNFLIHGAFFMPEPFQKFFFSFSHISVVALFLEKQLQHIWIGISEHTAEKSHPIIWPYRRHRSKALWVPLFASHVQHTLAHHHPVLPLKISPEICQPELDVFGSFKIDAITRARLQHRTLSDPSAWEGYYPQESLHRNHERCGLPWFEIAQTFLWTRDSRPLVLHVCPILIHLS